MCVRSFADHCSELLEQQPENVMALGLVPAAALGVVMEEGAGGAAGQATAGSVVEGVDGDLDEQGQVGRPGGGRVRPLVQGGFQIADAFLFGAVVAGPMGRIVEGQDGEAGQDFSREAVRERWRCWSRACKRGLRASPRARFTRFSKAWSMPSIARCCQ